MQRLLFLLILLSAVGMPSPSKAEFRARVGNLAVTFDGEIHNGWIGSKDGMVGQTFDFSRGAAGNAIGGGDMRLETSGGTPSLSGTLGTLTGDEAMPRSAAVNVYSGQALVFLAGDGRYVLVLVDRVAPQTIFFRYVFQTAVAAAPQQAPAATAAPPRPAGPAARPQEDGRDLAVVPTRQELDRARQGRRFAVLIGISRYENPEIHALRYTLNDVEKLRATLVDSRQGRFTPQQMRVLTERAAAGLRPNKKNIEKSLNWLAASASHPADTALIFFSGHGYNDHNGSYLLTLESDPDALLSTALNVSDFNKMVANIPARKKIVILDACHAGGMSRTARSNAKMSGSLRERLLAQGEMAEGEIRFLSCKESEQSFEDPSVGQGVFSHYLVRGLRGSADRDSDGVITFSELETYVQQEVVSWAAQRGKRQTPTSDTHISGPVILSETRR